MDFNLLYKKEILVVLVFLLLLLDAEYPGQIFAALLVPELIRRVFKNEIHLCIADECSVELNPVLSEQTVQCEFCDHILGTEEGVDLYACQGILYWSAVDDKNIFEHECGEWLEMDLFKGNITLNLL